MWLMPRPSRLVQPGVSHHIAQRGNYRQRVFLRGHLYAGKRAPARKNPMGNEVLPSVIISASA